jgi:phage terminase large subunit
MNNFMPSNLTTALYNQVSQGNRGSEYSYDINLNLVNKSLNEYNMGSVVSSGANNDNAN